MRRNLVLTLLIGLTAAAGGQSTAATQQGWQISGLPALNFNADEGFGYGVIAQAYNYGRGGLTPYQYMIQPLVFLTTKGRRDVSVFFDAPHLLPSDWRLGAYLGREQQLATPYYGVGNDAPYSAANEAPPNPYFYRYGREGVRFSTDLQHSLVGALRVLGGVGTRSTTIDDMPFDSGTTLLRTQLGGAPIPSTRATYVRAGLVYDTRDRESGPTKGQWTELLVQRGMNSLGGDYSFTRITATARAYFSLTPRLVFAERVMAQNLSSADAPFYELPTVQGSFKDDEAVGGAGSVRGWPKNRFIGKGMAFANQELRWRVADFNIGGRSSALVLNGFADAGRVWTTGLSTKDLLSDLHVGYGGGMRLRYGQDFVVGVDVGHSPESTAAIYIGLGYPF
ncbi:MAG TPA: BamA/TamA family outer membrane protein [Gemmatimonadaceae bacterium]